MGLAIKFKERRKFLKLVGFGFFTATFLAPLAAKSFQRTPRKIQKPFKKLSSFLSPRYKKRKKIFVLARGLRQGFYENPYSKSKTVHYVFPDRRIWGIEKISIRRLKKTRLSQKNINRLFKPTASRACEVEAVRLLQNRKNISGAQNFLLMVTRYDSANNLNPSGRPSYRLYDLLAGLSVRFNRPADLKVLIGATSRSSKRNSFESRFTKWLDKNSSWYHRWHNRKSPVYWKWNLAGRSKILKL